MAAALVASPSSWTSSLPYAPHHHTAHHHTVLQTANWGAPPSVGAQKPRLRLAVSLSVLTPASSSSWDEKPRKFDPFVDEPPVASTSQNTPPAPARGRALTPLSISTSAPAPAPQPTTSTVGRRRSPSFSAGSGTPLPPRVGGAAPLASLTKLTLASQRGYYSTASASSSHYAHSTPASSSSHNYSPYSNAYSSSSQQYSYAPASGSLASAPSPPPSLTRSLRAASPAPSASSSAVKSTDAPTPFHARHYSTPDARARLLARTLLNRIHAVGRPRSCSSQLRVSGSSSKSKDGYENECGGRGYIPSRLSVCTMAA